LLLFDYSIIVFIKEWKVLDDFSAKFYLICSMEKYLLINGS
jgi:hypothetical protein